MFNKKFIIQAIILRDFSANSYVNIFFIKTQEIKDQLFMTSYGASAFVWKSTTYVAT